MAAHPRTRRRVRQRRPPQQAVLPPLPQYLTGGGIDILIENSRTALNLLQAFAVAVKHNLRFEPAIAYRDLIGLVSHLETFARDAHVDDPDLVRPVHKTAWKATGEYLGVSFAESNPRKLLKRAKKPLGHLPIEILNHLSTYVNHCTTQGLFPSATYEGQLSTFLFPRFHFFCLVIKANQAKSHRGGLTKRMPQRVRAGARHSAARSV